MAEFVGAGPFYPDTTTAGVGVNNKAIKNAAPTGDATTKTTSINPATWQLFKPGATSSGVTGGTGASPSPTTGSDMGYEFVVADFDATSAAPGGLPANRVVGATTVTVAFPVNYSGVNTSNTFAALFYKRTSGGVLTFLASGVSSTVASTTTNISFTVSLPRTVFAPGETLHVEFWCKAADVVAGSVHQTVTFNTGSGTTLNPSLRYDYPRSYSIIGAGLTSLVKQTAKVAFSISGVGAASFARAAALARSFSISGTGVVSLSKRIAKAPFSIAGVGVVSWLVLITQAVLDRITGSGVTPDWPLNSPTKAIAGVCRDEDTGTVISGATCKLVRDIDEVYIAQTTSAADGTYSFSRGGDDPYTYHVYVYKAGTNEIHGVTDRGQIPA